MDKIPEEFNHSVQVPGLVSLATSSVSKCGSQSQQQAEALFRKTHCVKHSGIKGHLHIDGPVPPVAVIKVSKSDVWNQSLSEQ